MNSESNLENTYDDAYKLKGEKKREIFAMGESLKLNVKQNKWKTK